MPSSQWDQVKDSIGYALERNSSVEGMLKILSLNYLDLPHHLRSSLLYLSIFPEDHSIKDSLIRRWIGEGFIREQDRLTAYESGERCFNELINRSLIQPEARDKYDELKSCRVHATVLDFLVSKAVEENFVTLIGVPGVNPIARNKIRRLSMHNDGKIPSGLVLSSVRALNVFGAKVEIPSLLEFRLLRVLAFESCRQLKDDHLADAGDLLYLRYLRLNDARAVTELPEEIAELQHLKTLDVHAWNRIMEIPTAICQVERLECLVTLVVHDENILPDKIADMKALHVLEGVNIYIQSVNFIKQLGVLTNLVSLGIRVTNSDFDQEWKVKYQEFTASFCKLSEGILHSLHIITLNEPVGLFFDDLCEEGSDQFSLWELVIEEDEISGLAAWWSLLVNLQKLSFDTYKRLSEEDVETPGRLPNLEYHCIDCEDAPDDPEMKAPLERAMEAHPNRPKLVWMDEY